MSKTTPFDVAEYLDSPEMIAAYIEAAMEEGDPAFIAKAVGEVARAIGMSKIAGEAGLSREALYKGLTERGNPTLGTLAKVFEVMGLRLSVQPIAVSA
jgi:probable addiction module antidote protein